MSTRDYLHSANPEPSSSASIWRGVAILLGLALVASVVLLSRSEPVLATGQAQPVVVESAGTPLPTSSSVAAAVATGVGASPTAAASVSTSSLTVHVRGSVRSPGVYRMHSGDRVQDLVDEAGGLTKRVRAITTNLARPLVDGELVVVGTDVGSVATTDASAGATGAVAKVSLNTATVDQLDTLPRIGPVTAAKIIAWREENDGFQSIEQLQEVPGIGPATFAGLEPMVTL